LNTGNLLHARALCSHTPGNRAASTLSRMQSCDATPAAPNNSMHTPTSGVYTLLNPRCQHWWPYAREHTRWPTGQTPNDRDRSATVQPCSTPCAAGCVVHCGLACTPAAAWPLALGAQQHARMLLLPPGIPPHAAAAREPTLRRRCSLAGCVVVLAAALGALGSCEAEIRSQR
jgi:hypothetical protein